MCQIWFEVASSHIAASVDQRKLPWSTYRIVANQGEKQDGGPTRCESRAATVSEKRVRGQVVEGAVHVEVGEGTVGRGVVGERGGVWALLRLGFLLRMSLQNGLQQGKPRIGG